MARSIRNFLVYYYFSLTALTLCSSNTPIPKIKLSSNHDMYVVGLGTWQIKPEDVDAAITTALENGYRHIDTAWIYHNEEAIGLALKKWLSNGNKREDLFITTKLPPDGNRAADVQAYLEGSLKKLGLDYVDMYLIHTPTGLIRKKDALEAETDSKNKPKIDYDTDHLSIWKAMEEQVKAGRAKSIGLSNFNETQIQNVLNNCSIKPSNLQIEIQAYNQQKSLRNFCKKNDIAVTAYSSLASAGSPKSFKTSGHQSLPKLLENMVVKKIAEAHNKTTAQVLLKHQVQEGLIVIPKSLKPAHIKSNIDLFDFELSQEELNELDGLDKGEEGRLFDFLIFKGIEKHRHYPWSVHIPK